MRNENSVLFQLFQNGALSRKESRDCLEALARHHVSRVARPIAQFVPHIRVAHPVTSPGQVAIPIFGDDDPGDLA